MHLEALWTILLQNIGWDDPFLSPYVSVGPDMKFEHYKVFRIFFKSLQRVKTSGIVKNLLKTRIWDEKFVKTCLILNWIKENMGKIIEI